MKQPKEAAQSAYFVHVDFIIINRVRTFTIDFDAWGRPHWTPQQTTWVSFWSWGPCWSPAWGTGRRFLVDRGWWTMSNIRSMNPCTEGWLLESKDNINVIAQELRIINSSYDWEMRNKRIFRPIRRP